MIDRKRKREMNKEGAGEEGREGVYMILYVPFSGEFIELSMSGENEESNFSIAKHRELLSLLEEPSSTLAESNLSMHWILNPFHLNFPTSHSYNNNYCS